MTAIPRRGAADRSQIRTSIFVMATIYSGNGSAPVKVRNISPSGALIEGDILPPSKSTVRLCRGSLAVTGTLKWSSGGRAGLRFDAPTNVAHWLPGGEAVAQQERVDAIFQEIKCSANADTTEEEPASATVTVADVQRVREVIEELAEEFSSDEYIVAKFGTKVQSLDIVSQILAKIAAVI